MSRAWTDEARFHSDKTYETGVYHSRKASKNTSETGIDVGGVLQSRYCIGSGSPTLLLFSLPVYCTTNYYSIVFGTLLVT